MRGTAGGQDSDTRNWSVVVLLFLAVLINYIDRGNLSLAAVQMMRDLRIAPAGMGMLLSAFFWTYAMLQIPAGYVVDRFSLKWTYAAALLLWSLASAAISLASVVQHLLLLRLMLGVGEAITAPASLAYIRSHFPEERRGLPTGVYLAGMMVGPALGAMVGALVLAQLGWRSLFLVTGLGGCLWLIPWLTLAPSGSALGSHNPEPHADPSGWLELFRRPTMWGITIGAFFYSYCWYFLLTWLPSYLVMDRGLSILKMGSFTAAPLAAMAVVTPIGGRLADRFSRRLGNALDVRRAFTCGGFVLGSGILLLLRFRSPGAILLVLLLSLTGLGLAAANYWAITQAFSPPGLTGRVVGYQNMVANLAGIAAPNITGLLVDRTKNFELAILFAGISLLLAACAYLLLVREADVTDPRTQFSAVKGS